MYRVPSLTLLDDYFIEEVIANRELDPEKVKELATGEFYLGIEAYNNGLVDALGDKKDAEEYIKKIYDLEDVDYIIYETKPGLFDAFGGVFSDFFFNIGEGFGAMLIREHNNAMLI